MSEARAPDNSASGRDDVTDVRKRLDTWRSLLQEVARAELESSGLLVDFGTADQHKYTLGGFQTGWGENGQDEDGTSFSQIIEDDGELRFLLRDARVKEIAVRARSARSDQSLTVSIDGKKIGSAKLGEGWSILRFPARGLAPGRHELALSLARGDKDEVRAEVDWLWLSTEKNAIPLLIPRVGPMKLGDRPRRALASPGHRAYSFYLHVPDRASLSFDFGSDKPAEFRVRAETVDGKTVDLFHERTGDGKWHGRIVDLAPVGGQAVRLELSTSGEPGLTGWAEPSLLVPRSRIARRDHKATKRPRNVIVIVIDTSRYDSYGPFGGKDPFSGIDVLTPAYDAFAATATVFANAYNSENWTKPSVTTSLSGLYPGTHNARYAESIVPEEVTFITKRLKEAGFTTGLITANAVVSDKFGFHRGFDTFLNFSRGELARNGDARGLYTEAADWVEKNKDKPFFLWIQPVDPHTTYRVPSKYWRPYYNGTYKGKLGSAFTKDLQFDISKGKLKASADDHAWIRALYWGETTFHDEHMGRFLRRLKKLGLLENTLVVITNDHGEELNDHGKMGHGWTLYEEQIRAPLIMHYPPLFPAGERVEEIIEHVDLGPTILDVLGLEALPQAEGASFLDLVKGRNRRQRPFYAIVHARGEGRAVRVGDWKLAEGGRKWRGLYNISRDPGEKRDLLNDAPLARRLCEVYLGEGLAVLDKKQRMRNIATRRSFTSPAAKLDAETRKALEALGYL